MRMHADPLSPAESMVTIPRAHSKPIEQDGKLWNHHGRYSRVVTRVPILSNFTVSIQLEEEEDKAVVIH